MMSFKRAHVPTFRPRCCWPWLTWLVFSLSLLIWSLAHAAGPNTRPAAADVNLLDDLSDAKAIDGVDRGLNKRSIASLAVYRGETGLFSTLRRHEGQALPTADAGF